MFWFVDPKECGILTPLSGIKPVPPALEGKVLATGLPGSPQSGLTYNRRMGLFMPLFLSVQLGLGGYHRIRTIKFDRGGEGAELASRAKTGV